MRNAAIVTRRLTIATLTLALSVAIFAEAASAQDAVTPRSASVSAAPEVCDGPAPVCALLVRFLTAFNARDFNAFRQTFADSISFFVDRPYPPRRLDGRTLAENVFANGFAPYGAAASTPKPPLPVPLVASHLRVQAFGDVAVISFEVVRPTELARRTLVAHRERDEWRIVHIHASSADVTP